MSTDTLSVAHRFARAFNTRDVNQVLEVFTEDAVYNDLFYGRFQHHAGLRELFDRMYSEGTQHEWSMTQVAQSAGCTIGQWRFAFTISDAAPRGAGRILRFPGVSVFETRAGRCHTYSEYFDRTAALLAVGIAPDAVARIVAHRPSVEMSLPERGTPSR
jgi:ketosteroid isomerase-like protein